MYSYPIELEHYLQQFSSPESPLLAQLNRQTHLQVLMPRMLSGHVQGKLLELISKMIRPQRVLEIGTFTGYSAICLAQGLAPGGRLTTIERNDELEDFIRHYIEQAGLSEQIELLIGDATQELTKLHGPWDLVFIDADKPNYPLYYDLVIDHLRPGGWLLADNVLWDGKVVDAPDTFDEYTQGIVDFNERVRRDPRVENLILPFRDGINIVRKR